MVSAVYDEMEAAVMVTFDQPVACVVPGATILETPVGDFASAYNTSAQVIRFDADGAGDPRAMPWFWNGGAELLVPPADPDQTGMVE